MRNMIDRLTCDSCGAVMENGGNNFGPSPLEGWISVDHRGTTKFGATDLRACSRKLDFCSVDCLTRYFRTEEKQKKEA